MNVILSFYCGCAVCCGEPGKLTYSGQVPRPMTTIAAPRTVRIGTVVFVTCEKLGWIRRRMVVQDRMSRRIERQHNKERWDVYVGPSDHEKAKTLGIIRATITFEPSKPKAPKGGQRRGGTRQIPVAQRGRERGLAGQPFSPGRRQRDGEPAHAVA